MKLYKRNPLFQGGKIRCNSYPLPLVYETTSGIREIRTGTAGYRRDSPVQVLLSAKKVVSLSKCADFPHGNHDGCMAKTFAHSKSCNYDERYPLDAAIYLLL